MATRYLLGINELELVKLKDRKKFIVNGSFRNQDTGEEVSFGEFMMPSLKQLKTQVGELKDSPCKKTNIEFTILTGIDTGYLQTLAKTHVKAMFQVASNFNCLENAGRFTADCGSLVDQAVMDSTQGPAAVFGPVSGYLYRAHFIFNGKGQTMDRQINLIEDVEQYVGKSVFGKLIATGCEKDLTCFQQIEDIKIGLHCNLPVIYGRNGRANVFKQSKPYELIDQCFSASINLSDYSTYHNAKNTKLLVRYLLRAAYEGAYLSSITRNTNSLYLTLIGGGSFMNPLDVITEEIIRAHRLYANHPASHLSNIYLVVYSAKDSEKIKSFMTDNNFAYTDS